MKLFLRNLCGKTVELEVDDDITPKELMEKVQDKEGIPPEQQRLTYAGKMFSRFDSRTLKEVGLKDQCTIHLVLGPLRSND